MHGGQAIPAFDFYLAPYVRNSFIEEIKNLEELNGQDYSHLYQRELDDYVNRPLEGLSGDERIIQHAVNKTVSRVHQSMEAFIHNPVVVTRWYSVLLITERTLRPKDAVSSVRY